MSYLFADVKAKSKEHGYRSLSDGEKWDWHGDLYGWRRVYLSVLRDVRTSPCDPDGKWFDPQRADIAEAHYRVRLGAKHRSAT